MLVLSRKRNESVMIGDNVTVTIVEIKGDRVKLAFQGPREVPIHRTEVYERLVAESVADFPHLYPAKAECASTK